MSIIIFSTYNQPGIYFVYEFGIYFDFIFAPNKLWNISSLFIADPLAVP